MYTSLRNSVPTDAAHLFIKPISEISIIPIKSILKQSINKAIILSLSQKSEATARP
jgi:hypothetical protein